ncbi:MAG: sodium:alanine symporter family protein [Calditrichia bacterium]
MKEILDLILEWTFIIRNFVWGNWMIALLVITGIILTFATGFIQVRRLKESLKLVLKGAKKQDYHEDDIGDISPFQALMTALAATVGNGNIAGVATAIATGGPGAPVWMWISAFFGMATKYAEGFLGVKYREVAEDGSMAGGPMYYIKHGIKNKKIAKPLAAVFAACGAFTALFGTGNMAQSNSMALAIHQEFGISPLITGIILVILTGLVVIGGIKRIGAVAEKLVPTMILFYFTGALIIILANISHVVEAFELIFTAAFNPRAVAGGVIGVTVQRTLSLGVSRGVLSNESGLGSAAIAQSASKSSDPYKNGLIAMTGTFIDTIVVNTITTLVIVLTGVWKFTPFMGKELGADGLSSTALTATAFNTVIPFGGSIIAVASLLFGYSTLLGWVYYGEQCIEYLWGLRVKQVYRFLYIGLLFIGAILHGKYLDIVWNVGDIANAMMAIPNLVGLLLLTAIVAKITKEAQTTSS